jgi:phospholipid:diacylglycerol acyltransferase
MKVYCLYGVGLPTERSYYYTKAKDDIVKKDEADCKLDVLLNETNIDNEDLMDAVIKKSINEDKKEDNNSSPTTPIVSIMHERQPVFFF